MAYVYRHIRLDKNEPFYIGIGTTDDDYKRAYDKSSRNYIRKRIVKKTDYKVQIVFEDNDIKNIKEKEIEFIKIYGRINKKTGILSNLNDGGDCRDPKMILPCEKVIISIIIDQVINNNSTIRKEVNKFNIDIEKFNRLFKYFYKDNYMEIRDISKINLNKTKAERAIKLGKSMRKDTPENINQILYYYFEEKLQLKQIAQIMNINDDLIGKIVNVHGDKNLLKNIKSERSRINGAKANKK